MYVVSFTDLMVKGAPSPTPSIKHSFQMPIEGVHCTLYRDSRWKYTKVL